MHTKYIEKPEVGHEQVQSDSVVVRMTQHCEKGWRKTAKRNNVLDREVKEIIPSLQRHPELGMELSGNLSGFRCVHSHDNQFRIIYQYDKLRKEVTVHAIGHRSNVYEELARYLKRNVSHEFASNEIPVARSVSIA
jgi:mRNA-degrading endonuclease RelE of RelBE toxin-antitoxin system